MNTPYVLQSSPVPGRKPALFETDDNKPYTLTSFVDNPASLAESRNDVLSQSLLRHSSPALKHPPYESKLMLTRELDENWQEIPQDLNWLLWSQLGDMERSVGKLERRTSDMMAFHGTSSVTEAVQAGLDAAAAIAVVPMYWSLRREEEAAEAARLKAIADAEAAERRKAREKAAVARALAEEKAEAEAKRLAAEAEEVEKAELSAKEARKAKAKAKAEERKKGVAVDEEPATQPATTEETVDPAAAKALARAQAKAEARAAAKAARKAKAKEEEATPPAVAPPPPAEVAPPKQPPKPRTLPPDPPPKVTGNLPLPDVYPKNNPRKIVPGVSVAPVNIKLQPKGKKK